MTVVSDAARAANGGPRSMLDGLPILLKDNYDTHDMATTAGAIAAHAAELVK